MAEGERPGFATDPVPAAVVAGDALRPGAVVAGRWEIRGRAGAGGMGAVYRAFDRTLKEDVALKVLGGDADAGRLQREVKLARRIAHPGVCRVYDVGEEGGLRFLSMEWIEGEDLRAVLARGRLDAAQALRIVKQVAAGLAAAHAQGVIHRDLKPENVMLRAGGDAVVVDFGLARGTVDAGRVSQVAGTPRYMAPEQLRGEALDARCDVFACGVLGWELVTGEHPFGHGSAAEVTSAILRDEPPTWRGPAGVEGTLRRALAKDPSARFADAAAFGEALAGGAAPLPPLGRVRSRAPALLLLAAAAGVLVWLVQHRRAQRADERPTVAVAAFDDLTGDPALAGLAPAAREAAAAALRAYPRVRVAAKPAGSTWTVTGSVQRVGARLRFTAQLASSPPIQIDGDPADASAALALLGSRVVDEARLAWQERHRRAEADRGTKNAQARAKLHAYYDLVGPAPSVEHIQPGRKLLDDALALDPTYAPGRIERAYLGLLSVEAEGNTGALDAALADLDAAGDGPDARVMRCRALQFAIGYRGTPTDEQLGAALAACDAALAADPESARVRMVLARLHDLRCEDELAMELLDRARSLDRPLAGPILSHLIDLDLQNHRLASTDKLSEELVAVQDEEERLGPAALSRRAGVRPTRGAHVLRAGVLLRLGRRDQARGELLAEIAAAAAGRGDSWAEAAALAGVLRLDPAGAPDGARARLDTLENDFRASAAERPIVASRVAAAYRWVDPEGALAWLGRAGAPQGCDAALPAFITSLAAGAPDQARAAVEACRPQTDYQKSCRVWMERQVAPR